LEVIRLQKKHSALISVLAFLVCLSGFTAALGWCVDEGGQTLITARTVTRATDSFAPYAECSYDASGGVYSCADYCVDGFTLAKFHCSLQQPSSRRVVKMDSIDCVAKGYAGCVAGACVTHLPAAAVVAAVAQASPSPKPKAWCKTANVLSSAAPNAITGADENGASFVFTDYCSDPKTLARYSCDGVSYSMALEKCAKECASGICSSVLDAVVPSRNKDSGAWIAYGVIGVLVIAGGVAYWLYSSADKRASAKKAEAKNAQARKGVAPTWRKLK
jgi:hypothetical protein